MKSNNIIVWVSGAASVVLAALGLFFVLGRMDNPETETDGALDLVVGTYGESVYRYRFDSSTMSFELVGQAQARNASYALGLSSGSCKNEGTCREGAQKEAAACNIFAVSETGAESGACSFESRQADGDDIVLSSEKRQTGADPCFVMLYGPDGADFPAYMLTADYSGGSISVFPIMDGKLGDRCEQLLFEGSGAVSSRQEASHIHQLKLLPKQGGIYDDYILATDLGADVIRLIYTGSIISETRGSEIMLTHIDDIPCPAGSGPRHMEFSPDGKLLYCIAELSGEVLVYEIGDLDGMPTFTLIQQIQADEVKAGGSADIHIHPSGKWIYTSHRLDNDGIAIFNIKKDGLLEKSGYCRTARHPRNFIISPEGDFLLVACRDDRLIQTFRINGDGSLSLTPAVLQFEKDMPSSVTAVSRH